MTDGQWMTYTEAGVRLGINAEAVRRRADRGKWARMPGNDGRTRVRVPDDVRAPQAPPVRADASALVSALEAHIATLKTDIERLTAELAGERAAHQEQLAAARAAADRATAELVALARRLAAIAEKQTSAETAAAEPEPPRRSAAGRAWRWFLRN
jgi:hypothetical protein